MKTSTITANKTTAYLLCVFLGFFGAHRFYLRRMKSGIASVALILIPLIYSVISYNNKDLSPMILGFVVILAAIVIVVWWIADLFLLPRFVNNGESSLSSRNLSKLEQLHSLFEKGVISEDEYKKEKSKLI